MKKIDIKPLYAEYGYLDTHITGHHLISFDGDPSQLPKQLLGLTDVPPSPPSEWWPSVGCAPLDNWFALWWTMPDFSHHRGGVVKSKVALWPLDRIGEVEDISLALIKIGNIDKILDISSSEIETILNQLISSQKPLIFSDLKKWPHILSQVWKLLWPEARKNFSANLAFMPDHVSNSLNTWIHCVPRSKTKSWPEDQFVRISIGEKETSRMSEYLFGNSNDTTLSTYFHEFILAQKHPSQLGKVIRAAERYDAFISNTSFESALNLLRTLSSIQPERGSLNIIKKRCIEIISQSLKQQNLTSIISLSNIDSASLLATPPMQELKIWFQKNLPSQQFEDLKNVILKLRSNSACDWWQQGLLDCIDEQVAIPIADAEWNLLLLKALIDNETSEIIQSWIPFEMEESLVSSWKYDERLESLDYLINISKSKKWDKLHAKCMVKKYGISKAFDEQLLLGLNNIGLPILIMDFPGEHVIQEVMARANYGLIDLLAHRTVTEPKLLNGLNISEKDWLNLWHLHITKRGCLWPPALEPTFLVFSLFDKLVAEDEKNILNDLISVILSDISAYTEKYSNREKLWNHLNHENKINLSKSVAKRILNQSQIERVQEPERILSSIVIELSCEEQRLSVVCLLNLLTWRTITETQARKLLSKIDWSREAQQIGIIVSSKDWKIIAKDIYSAYKNGQAKYAPAAQAIRGMLGILERFMIKHIGTGTHVYSSSQYSLEDLIPIIAEIGADLAPQRLESIWVKAGGKAKHLKPKERADDGWLYAVNLAFKNGGRKNVEPIVDVLLEEFPNNEYLKVINQQMKFNKK